MQEYGVFLDDEGRVSLKKTTYLKLRKLDSFLKEREYENVAQQDQ